jgi:hypothetical protein
MMDERPGGDTKWIKEKIYEKNVFFWTANADSCNLTCGM